MTVYVYQGDAGRYYPDFSITVNPGDEHEFMNRPDDGRWFDRPEPKPVVKTDNSTPSTTSAAPGPTNTEVAK